MIINGLCYKKKNGNTFLECYSYMDEAQALKEAQELNETKPARLRTGKVIDWTNIEYFFIERQEAFC